MSCNPEQLLQCLQSGRAAVGSESGALSPPSCCCPRLPPSHYARCSPGNFTDDVSYRGMDIVGAWSSRGLPAVASIS